MNKRLDTPEQINIIYSTKVLAEDSSTGYTVLGYSLQEVLIQESFTEEHGTTFKDYTDEFDDTMMSEDDFNLHYKEKLLELASEEDFSEDTRQAINEVVGE